MSKGFTSSYRTSLLACMVFAMFGGLGARLVWLHVIARDELLRSVEDARRQIIVENARRGDIVDVHGALLATSRSVVVLGVDPQFLRESDERKWPQLAALVGLTQPQLERIMTTKFRPVGPRAQASAGGAGLLPASFGALSTANASPAMPKAAEPKAPAGSDAGAGVAAVFAASLGAGADAEESKSSGDETVLDEPDAQGNRPIRWAKLSDEVSESAYGEIEKLGIRGVYGNRVYRRAYPHNDLAAHLVGYVDKDEHPVAGMEHYADFYLRGQKGWLESEKDGKSRELAQFRSRDVPASDGYNVFLTIDATVQRMAEEEVARIAQTYQPAKATIIVSDPRTGFILALANYPSFGLNDYNRLSRAEQGRMRNVAVADEYEPGSVFKIVAVSGALNEGLVTPASTFDCTLEKIDYNGLTRNLPREDKSDHFDHPLTVAEIVAHSSNKGAAQLAMKLGDQRFYDYARAFGFGQYTGFPVGGETAGSLRSPKKWDSLTITRMPMGQSVAASALQMHQAMGVIASGGLLLKPQIISRICDAKGGYVYRFDTIAVRRVISERTARTVAGMLMRVATVDGTAPQAAIAGYEVAGKTATAQKLEPVTMASGRTELRYSDRHHVASFIGFFPASRPQVAISVVVDDADARCPGGVAFGAKVAAPVFKRLGERLIPYLPIEPPSGQIPHGTLAMDGGSR